ncbi:hypothetical protein M513_05863 [Trichuris suis]|uniref:Uncharacterized protein n=1 Tax=Trichuris suis TaxID=68888 RepID=A0A085M836_9BILA|nr:hypothetical protein M513_05863 [Trichuris suis]
MAGKPKAYMAHGERYATVTSPTRLSKDGLCRHATKVEITAGGLFDDGFKPRSRIVIIAYSGKFMQCTDAGSGYIYIYLFVLAVHCE